MKFVIAQMQHETNTFSPVPTPWEEFGPKGPYLGRDAFEAMKGKGMAMAAFLDLAARIAAGVERRQRYEHVVANPSDVHRQAVGRLLGQRAFDAGDHGR